MSAPPPIVMVQDLSHRYGQTQSLETVSLTLPAGRTLALIGPDGVGKSTLLGLLAGARRIQRGEVQVFGGDMRDARHRNRVCARIAYMPQGLGRNLYGDLTVAENLHVFGRLFGQPAAERRARIGALLQATGLAGFPDRLAAKLSGGMKQKLGLCCALIHDPDLLVLDEPTTGVDPLSRQQFWALIERIRAERPQMSVIVATAYMEEAARFDTLIAMHDGQVLATGTAEALRERTGTESLEAAFVALLPAAARRGHEALTIPPRPDDDGEPVIVATELTRRFGDFVAVDKVSLRIHRGEIFGFLGSNGCGKTTTMKMLTGLLSASAGEAWLFGEQVAETSLAMRRRVGYMTQAFSLYEELTVRQNLALHGRLFHLPAATLRERLPTLLETFDLTRHADALPAALPLGVRQRLSLAVAVIHEPDLLILDEPTSGVDPVARDRFWRLLVSLSRERGVTIFISTHFMNEAERCDRISLMHAGRVLASDTPAALQQARDAPDLETAFVDYLREAAGEDETPAEPPLPAPPADPSAGRPARRWPFSSRRMRAFLYRESLSLLRDPIRLSVALIGTALLMLIFGYGISLDVEDLPFAVLDRDDTPESRAYVENLAGSRYFIPRSPLRDEAQMQRRLQTGELTVALEIPSGFGRSLRRGSRTEIAAWIDGAMPFRAETVAGYLQGAHLDFLARELALQPLPAGTASLAALPVRLEPRFRYNQAFESINAMVPAVIALLLVFIPSILMALAVVREKELGSITNLYVTPAGRLEFLIGKQLPYVAVGMVNFALMTVMATWLFGVPLKGSLLGLTLGALAYVAATTAIGLLMSAFTRTQIAALFGTAIVTMMPAVHYSGMLQPVSSLEGSSQLIGQLFPTTYFVKISVGAFAKGLSLVDLVPFLLPLAVFAPTLLLLSLISLRRQAA